MTADSTAGSATPRPLAAAIPPAGPLRTVAWATLANTVGLGLWLAGYAMFLTRGVGLSASSVGLGLTIAGFVGLLATVPLGRLADRRDPRSLRALLQLLQAAVAACYLLVDSFPTFLAVAVCDALLAAGNLSVRAALVAAVAASAPAPGRSAASAPAPGRSAAPDPPSQSDRRIHAFATLRAVASVGISAGAALAAPALAVDTRTAYLLLVAGNIASYLVSAALIMRLPALPPATTTRVPGWKALRDKRFLAVSAASAVVSLHATAFTLVVPLWIVNQTQAPRTMVSAVLITNTVLTVLLAVWISRGAGTALPAARMMRRAGFILAAAMILYAGSAARLSVPAAAGLLLAATAVYTIGDLFHATAAAGLAYDLAAPEALGEYQGVDGLVTGLARAAGPALLTLLLIDGPPAGWAVLGGVFVATGLAAPALTRRALTRPNR